MIREIVTAAWAKDPYAVAAAILLTPVVLALLWGSLVVAIVALSPMT